MRNTLPPRPGNSWGAKGMERLEQQFNALVSEYSERIWWHVRRMVCSHEDADDLVQEIFLKVWTALPSWRGEAQPYTWLWRIATNETLNFLRRRKVRAMLSFSSLDAEMERRIDEDPYFNGDQAERLLSQEIRKLPERQRQVFILRYYDELPYEQISEILDSTVGSLKASYHLACGKIKASLQNFSDDV